MKSPGDASIAGELSTPNTNLTLRKELVSEAQKKSKSQLKSMMGLSDKLADGVFAMYKGWNNAEKAPAASIYDGPAYKGLNADTLGKAEVANLQRHLRIVSAIYGLAKPCDAIQHYRMEFGQKDFNLYDRWGETLAREVLDDLREQLKAKEMKGLRPLIINVASDEYANAVLKPLRKMSDTRDILIIKCVFKTAGKSPMVYAKAARGLVARHLAVAGVHCSSEGDLQKLKNFNAEGYAFDNNESSEDTYVFARGAAPQKKAAVTKPPKRKAEELLV